MAAVASGSPLSFRGRQRNPRKVGRFPFLAWAMVLVSKGSATSSRGFDLDETAQCLLRAFPSISDLCSPKGWEN